MRPIQYILLYMTIVLIWICGPVHSEEHTSTRAIVRAVDEAWISTDLDVRIDTLPVREGQAFTKGDILATFDCGDLIAQLKSAEAVLRAEVLTTQNNARLAKLNAVGNFEVDLSRSKTEQAEAEVEAFHSKLSRCTIFAPFDGRVSVMRAHAHEFPDRTAPLMQIIGETEIEIDILLPGVWLRWMRPGVAFSVDLEETGTTVSAEIVRVGAVVDPVSQTVKVTGRIAGDVQGVLPGMSGPARFTVPNG